jgi:hypothetical protein
MQGRSVKMATWIGHLRIAEKLINEIPGLDETAFTLGNLGPDSGKPNADWSQFDPPKAVSHFIDAGIEEDKIKDLEIYRRYQVNLSPTDDPAHYSYMLGYFFHLLCDNLWSRRVWHTSKKQFAGQYIEQGKEFIWALKQDWYDLDFKYVRDHPDCLFWRVLVPAPNPPAYLPFIVESACHWSLNHIRQFYSQPDPNRILDRIYPYLNETTMARYVTDAAEAVLVIHNTLATMPPPLDGQHSALCLLQETHLAPYEVPLGDVI